MTAAVREWLPKDAFSEGLVKRALAGTIGDWSQEWFSGHAVTISSLRRDERSAPFAGGGDLCVFQLSGRGKRAILEAALNLDLSGETFMEGDHKLSDALVAKIADDLGARLTGLLVTSSDSLEYTRMEVVLSLDGNELGAATFPECAIVPLLKASMLRQPSSRKIASKRSDALGPTRFGVDGFLGHADIAVEELQNLAVGDVLVLEKSISDPIDLHLSGRERRPVARGKLGRKDGRVAIQF